METIIGGFMPDNNSVEVTFIYAGVSFTRRVNACLTEDGEYDQEATAERVAAVALGVQYKIENGIIESSVDQTE